MAAARHIGIGVGAGLGTVFLATSAYAAQSVTVSATDTGSRYEGVGAVSGGGATSVFLRDYVEPQRSQILDFLFKPHFGAGLQELYVEIGGDGNSTQGSEPSHERTATDKNFDRGYEWWLMEQARARNPNIQLDVTAWSAPGWVGGGTFFSPGTTTYLADYIAGAKSAHGLDLNYIGCRNEKGIDETFLQTLRSTLNGAGLQQVGIHGFDNWEYATGAQSPWNWVLDLATNASLASDVYAIGEHTTWGEAGAPPDAVKAAALAAGKPIWDTEEHVYETGFRCEMDITKAYLQNYVQSRVTKTVYWYLVSAFYPIEPFYNVTMALASNPWSGAYAINPALWAYAHITQFADPGWQFLDNASGTLAGGGDYATLLSPTKTDFSIILDTGGASATQSVTFVLADGLSAASVDVWRSDASAQFQQQTAIPVSGGSFTVDLEANAIYSITSTKGQTKGTAPTSPTPQTFPFPYYENYDHYGDLKSVGYRPYYHADIAATFELADRPDGNGQCLHQVVSQPAQSWAPEVSGPYTIVGDNGWRDYEVSVDVSPDGAGWASLMGRVNGVGTGYGTGFKGYYLTLNAAGSWAFYVGTGADTNNAVEVSTTLASGTATLGASSWHNLKLVFAGTTLNGLIDGTQVFSVTDSTFAYGQVGLGTQSLGGTYATAYFDNLMVNDVGAGPPPPTVFVQDGQRDAGADASADAGDAGVPDDAAADASPGPDGGRGAGTRSSGCSCHSAGASEEGGVLAAALGVAALAGRGIRRLRRSARAAART
jgi:galactosylceramidase